MVVMLIMQFSNIKNCDHKFMKQSFLYISLFNDINTLSANYQLKIISIIIIIII